MIDLLLSPCGQLLTLAGANAKPRRGDGMQDVGLIQHGAVGINLSTGAIEYAGPASKIEPGQLSRSCPVIDATDCVVLPGFVDSHTHLVFAGDRADEFYRRAQGESYQSIAGSGGGISKTMAATRAASPGMLLDLARQRLHRLYDNGTTAVEVKTGYGLSRATELEGLAIIKELRGSEPALITSTLLAAHLIPPEYREQRAAYVELCVELAEIAGREGLADFCDVFVDPMAFSQAEAGLIVTAAKQAGLAIKLHADEFSDDGTAVWGVGEGAVSLDHLGGVGEVGISALAASDTVATLLPATMFFSGHGKYAPGRRMLDAGCALALATDLNPGSSLVYSLPLVMTFAVLQMGFSAEACIVAATINGAHALGLAGQTGSLEPGKRADVVVLDIADYHELPYHVGCDLVRDVFIQGQAVKRNGVMTYKPG